MRSDRARLLIPIWLAPGSQYVPGQSAADKVSLVVPGVPESSSAYELTPGGLRPLRHSREMGGMQVVLEEFGLTSLVLLAHDSEIIAELGRQAAAIGPRAAEIQRALAAAKFRQVGAVTGELATRVVRPRQATQWLDGIKKRPPGRATPNGAARQYQAAYLSAHRAMRALRLMERAYWEAVVLKLPSPVVGPATVSFPTLPWHGRLQDRIAASHPGPNLLPGGDFEDLA